MSRIAPGDQRCFDKRRPGGEQTRVTYAAALARLNAYQMFGFKPGLDSTRRLAALAGNPQESLRFIHVAGTNGKGSTCAMLESVYRGAGLRTGLYTSPHLVRFGERIQVNRQCIPDADLARLTAELSARADAAEPALQPTFFEFATVLALIWFAEQGCELVIWETGLGGRFDATNIVTPLASVITNIGWDHQAVLGSTLGAIAAEKAGIIKPEVPALTAAADLESLGVIRRAAGEANAPLIVIDAAARDRMDWPLALLGDHQRTNAALAAATVRLLRCLLPVTDEQLRAGLAEVAWPGRLQVVSTSAQTVVLDGAHNRPGVEALAAAVERHFPRQRPALILGMLADKDWREMVKTLLPGASRVVTTAVSSPRSVSAAELRAACQAAGVGRPARAASSLAEAFQWTRADPLVLVTGSLYLVGEAIEILGLGGSAAPAERALNHWAPPATP